MLGGEALVEPGRAEHDVGGSQRYMAGVYLGYDQPRSLGGYVQGGTFAAPIFKQVVQATRKHWTSVPVSAGVGVHFVAVDRMSGKQVFGGGASGDPKAGIIWEAFKAETVPDRQTREDQLAKQRDSIISTIRKAKSASTDESAGAETKPKDGNFAEQQGGVY